MAQAEDIRDAKLWLRRRREALGLSQAALGEIIGVDRRTIGNAESLTGEAQSSLPHGVNLWRMLQALDGLVEAPPMGGPLQQLRDEVAEGMAALARGIERIEERLDDSDGRAGEAR